MGTVTELAAPGVRTLQPYQPGLPLEELARRYGVTDAVKLASNENPLGPSPRVAEAVREVLPELARYPDGGGFRLKGALSGRLDVSPEMLTLGNGSNDVLELAARAFVTAEDEVVYSQHAFAVYPLVTRAIGASGVEVPARDWGHDLAAMREAVTDRTRMVFVANPNNPTGTWSEAADLKAFVAAMPEHVIVVVDEAYSEYAGHPEHGVAGYPDAAQWLAEYPNLVVTRTFSKAYGLAGLRVGYAISSPEVADLMNRVRQPFNVNSAALAAAEAALADTDHLEKGIAVNAEGMAALTAGFERLGLSYIPSAGNFVSVDVGRPADAVYERLLHHGVIVRPVGGAGMPNHLRISVGLAAENERCITALERVLAAA